MAGAGNMFAFVHWEIPIYISAFGEGVVFF
jgi:hypothetical protein